MLYEKIYRGDIFVADLSPCVGSEQGGTRPVMIIQNDVGNKFSPTVIVAPITSQIQHKSKLPTHIKIPANNGIKANSIILLEQIRTIDKTRLLEFKYSLDARTIHKINNAIKISLAL